MHRIDVHHHFYPPELLAAQSEADGGKLRDIFRTWTVARALEELDRAGIATAIVSTSSRPALRGGQGQARLREVARSSNLFAAEMVRTHPSRFGFFAFLPMPDVEGSLAEVAFALDELQADGIGLMTSYDDHWLGDPSFVPLLEELDRRAAIVYVHPLLPTCMAGVLPAVPPALVEFPYDTGRTIVSLLFSGALHRFGRIRWILSHGGGPLPMLSGRIESLARRNPTTKEIAPDGIEAEFRRLYCETANAAYRGPMAAVLAWLPVEHVLFGTDYPYLSPLENVEALQACGLAADVLARIERQNAVQLFERLRAPRP